MKENSDLLIPAAAIYVYIYECACNNFMISGVLYNIINRISRILHSIIRIMHIYVYLLVYMSCTVQSDVHMHQLINLQDRNRLYAQQVVHIYPIVRSYVLKYLVLVGPRVGSNNNYPPL